MLIIRESQLRILAADSSERWLVQHVTRCFPQYARALGEDQLLVSIRQKRARAMRYFNSEKGICLFIDLTCLFGDDFDEDPKLPWAKETLTRSGIGEADRRFMLYKEARAHLLQARAKAKREQHA